MVGTYCNPKMLKRIVQHCGLVQDKAIVANKWMPIEIQYITTQAIANNERRTRLAVFE